MEASCHHKAKRTSDHVDQKEIQSHRTAKDDQDCSTTWWNQKKVIAARPRGNPSYCHPTRMVRQPQQAQRRAPSVGGTLQFGILLSDGLVVGHWLTWPGVIASHPVTSYQTPHCRGVRAFGRGRCSCLFAGRLSKRHRLSCSGSDEALMLFPTLSLHIATTDPSV